MTEIIITGQMRSGTTLIANLLNQQKGIDFYPDFLHIARLKNATGVSSITEFMNIKQKKETIANFTGEKMSGLGALTKATRAKFALSLQEGEFNTLLEFYQLVLKKATTRGNHIVGHKTTAAETILEELLLADKNLLVLYIIRDARDVVLSNYFRTGQIPDIVIRNWKLGINSIMRLLDDEALRDRIKVICYEELINNTSRTLQEISDFIGLKQIIVPKKLYWYGKPYISNSSFGDIVSLFDKKGIGRWKTGGQWADWISQILAGRELKQLGYATERIKLTKRLRVYWYLLVTKIIPKAPSNMAILTSGTSNTSKP